MENDNRLGRKITTLREAHHLSTQDLADRCGCEAEVIEKLEAGEVPPSLAPLIKLTRALGGRTRKNAPNRPRCRRPQLLQPGGWTPVSSYGPLHHHGDSFR